MNFDDLLGRGGGGKPNPSNRTLKGDPLDEPLVELIPGQECLTQRDLCAGTLILGATGSGKSSGSGAAIRKAMLRSGIGGLVLTAKDDLADWLTPIREAGREKDLVIIGPGHDLSFNPLEYERTRQGRGSGLTECIVSLFDELEAIKDPGAGKNGGDPFFRQAARDLARQAVQLLMLAGLPLTVGNLYDLLAAAPTSLAQAKDPNWLKTNDMAVLITAAQTAVQPKTATALRRVRDYFLVRYAGMADRTRSSIAEGLITKLSVLSSGPLETLFGGQTSWTPDEIYRGKITIVDAPVLQYGELGRMVNVLLKASFMRDVQRREITPDTKPCFLFADEYQYHMTPGDQLFLTTARSSRCQSVFLTQNINNLYAALGGGLEAQPVVASLLGNLRNKIVHSVDDKETVEYLSELFGHEVTLLTGMSVPTGSQAERTQAGQLTSANLTPQRMFRVEPSTFAQLKAGSPANDFIVEGVVYRGGQKFANNKTYIRIAIDQRTGRAV
ncbi:MAG: type IV secretory system conjugative DNA transfer family protein [Fimbriiglobus sp.]